MAFYIKGVNRITKQEWYHLEEDLDEPQCTKSVSYKTMKEALLVIKELPLIDNGNGYYKIVEE